jgi:hypothetical protein
MLPEAPCKSLDRHWRSPRPTVRCLPNCCASLTTPVLVVLVSLTLYFLVLHIPYN